MYSWERKEEIMRRKEKLESREIYVDNDLIQEEREVQRKLKKTTGGERANVRETRVGYRRIEIVA